MSFLSRIRASKAAQTASALTLAATNMPGNFLSRVISQASVNNNISKPIVLDLGQKVNAFAIPPLPQGPAVVLAGAPPARPPLTKDTVRKLNELKGKVSIAQAVSPNQATGFIVGGVLPALVNNAPKKPDLIKKLETVKLDKWKKEHRRIKSEMTYKRHYAPKLATIGENAEKTISHTLMSDDDIASMLRRTKRHIKLMSEDNLPVKAKKIALTKVDNKTAVKPVSKNDQTQIVLNNPLFTMF